MYILRSFSTYCQYILQKLKESILIDTMNRSDFSTSLGSVKIELKLYKVFRIMSDIVNTF